MVDAWSFYGYNTGVSSKTSTAESGLAVRLRRAGLTLSACARLVGVSRMAVYSWVHGKSMPRTHHVRALAKLLGVLPSRIVRDMLDP